MAARLPQADQVLVAEAVNDSDTGRRSSTSSTTGHAGHGGLSHICNICSNRYERADYLKRHLASRTFILRPPLSTWRLGLDS